MMTLLAAPTITKTPTYDLGTAFAVQPLVCDGADLRILCADGTLLAVNHLRANQLIDRIKRKDLAARAVALTQVSPWAYLIISGDMRPNTHNKTVFNGMDNGNGDGWSWSSIQGALASVQELGVCVITIRSESDLPDMLVNLASRERKPYRLRPPHEALFVEPTDDLLLAIPGVGEATLGKLLKSCGSAAWVLAALTDPALSVPGIGDKTLENIRAAFRKLAGLREGERLVVEVQG